MIYQYYDKLVPEHVCNNLILHSNKCPQEFILNWGGRINSLSPWLVRNKEFLQTLSLLNSLASKTTNSILFPEIAEVCKWPEGTSQNPHFDKTRESTKYTSITYLNNNYKGGKTFFTLDNSSSKNNIGDTIMFDGNEYEHGVTKVTEGTRYVLAIWYSNNINDYLLNL